MSLLADLGHGISTLAHGAWLASPIGNALNAAANQQALAMQQQQTRQQAAEHQDLIEQLDAYSKGGVSAENVEQEPSGLKKRTANPMVSDPSRIVTTTGGKRIYIPTDQEAGKAFVPVGQLGESLKGLGWDGKTPITPEHTHSLMQALNEAQPKDEAYDVDLSGKFRDSNGNPRAAMIGKKSKTVTFLDAPDGGSFAPQDKPEKAPRTRAVVEGYSSPFLINEEDGSTTPIKLPAGVSPSMSPAQQQAAADRREREADRQEARGTREQDRARADIENQGKLHDALQQKEQEHWTKKQMYADAMEAEDGTTVIDPRSGQQVAMNSARRTAYKSLMGQAETAAKQFQNQAKRIRQQHGWGEFAPSAKAQQPAAPAPSALPGGHKIGDAVKLRSGKTVKITKIYPNGQFDAQ